MEEGVVLVLEGNGRGGKLRLYIVGYAAGRSLLSKYYDTI